MALTDPFFYIPEPLRLYLTKFTTQPMFPLFKCIINYVLSLNIPKMKCAGRGDSIFESSTAPLVHISEMSTSREQQWS